MIGLSLHVVLASAVVCGQSSFAHEVPRSGIEFEVRTTPWPRVSFTLSDDAVLPKSVSLPDVNGTASSYWGSARRPTVDPIGLTSPNTGHDGKDKENMLYPYLRYLWWVVVLYFFWAQAAVCDGYFVPTIETISDKFGIPDDIAGATVMALGCNGPELFINLVALLRSSDLGIGAVLGGEVFNLLVLSGCAVLATPAIFMPLKISKLSFTRDVAFYALSIGLIYWTLYDNVVLGMNAIVLLLAGVVYSTVVILTPKIRTSLLRKPSRTACSSPHSSMNENTCEVPEDPTCANASLDPESGCFLGVRVNMGNRMQDRFRHWETRLVTMKKEGLAVSTDVRDMGSRYGRTARGIVFEQTKDGLGRWRHGGLVNAPIARRDSVGEAEVKSYSVHEALPEGPDHDILPRTSSDPELAVSSVRIELIPLKDVVRCVEPVSATSTCFELQVLQHDSTLGTVISLEFDAKNRELRARWVSTIKHNMQLLVQSRTIDGFSASALIDTQIEIDGPASRPARALLMEWVEWFQFPVKFLLRVTIPNAKRLGWRLPASFFMAMVWLALFSFCVVEVCDILADEFKISVTVLGFTVAAVGTSFPNVISCIAVSRQGKTLMAIANALGANIQNVFIALALPWFLRWLINGDFKVTSGNINATVIAMVVTLVMLVFVVLIAGCKMARCGGVLFLLMYCAYLVVTFGQEFVCETWPFCRG